MAPGFGKYGWRSGLRGLRQSRSGRLDLRHILEPPLPMGGDPSFDCPETGARVTYTTCDECPLYQRWGDREIRICRHKYEESEALDRESEKWLENTLEENRRVVEKMGEDTRHSEHEFQEHMEYLESLKEEQEEQRKKSHEEFHRELDELTEAALRSLLGSTGRSDTWSEDDDEQDRDCCDGYEDGFEER
ncbi:MAG: hypothetical protein ABII79_05640 [bacterium]